MNQSTKLPTGKLLLIFVSETIKTSILPFTWVERNSNLFLMEFIFIWGKTSFSGLSLHNTFKTLMQSFLCVALEKWDLHSSRLIFEISFSRQLRTWDSCLINLSFNSLDPFLFKWSLLLFKWDLNFFVLSIRYRFLSLQRSFKCELTSLPFWFKRVLPVLHTILETFTSFSYNRPYIVLCTGKTSYIYFTIFYLFGHLSIIKVL